MSITDELRAWASVEVPYKYGNQLYAIADRIDAEHERAMAAAALIAGVPMTDKNMAEHGWIRLPKDADGEYINIGDVVVGKEDGEDDFIFEVYEIAFFPDGSCNIRAANDYGFDPWQVSHHHEPTVEDVLREFAEKVTDSQIPGVHPTYEEAIAEYAQRLQLREVDE